MCRISGFFTILLYYFVLLTTLTIFRKKVTYKGMFYTCSLFLGVFAGYLCGIFTDVILFNGVSEFNWLFNSVNWFSLEVSFSLRLDSLSYLFTLLVLIIGLATNFYVLNYIKYEANEDIFALLINWFMFSMIILVLGNNLFTLFLGWESIGLSSFFLINFWSTRRGTVKSSFKAFFFNKISDVFLFVFLVIVNYLTYLNNLNVINIKFFSLLVNFSSMYNFAALALFLCTLFKSAQLIGHLWLPDSMEAPVPASALIHSATLVSAGIYLLLRFTPLVTLTHIQSAALVVGSVTAAYGGIVSASQTDMKKLLAYSTISHCGFLFVTVGTQFYYASIIYLFLHGLFKASTFFCAGSFIRVAGSQDTRNMGNLSRILPVDTIFLIICAFNLGGLPFSLGYLYKTVLITSLLTNSSSVMVLGFCTIGLLTSVVYVYRLVYYSAFDTSKEFFANYIYELQQKHINVTKYWSLTTIVQIIAVTIILGFSLWVYVYFVNYFIYSDFALEALPISFNIDSSLILNANIFYKSYFELFYSLYVLAVFVIILVGWRVEYTFLYRLNFLANLTMTVLFAVLFSVILKMWGHILTEASTQQNFNFGFSTYKSEILVHLSQWQYWWWFWFSIWWALYYFIILRMINKRTFNFNIVMNTSVRGRGKWGDFLVALIPVSWCCNILINSNFILRMIEWQNESSLFTIRIQGKQWYWVYKYDPNTAQAVMSTPKNVGHNRWRVTSGQESYNADTYYQAIHLAAHLEFQDSYSKFIKKIDTHRKNLSSLSLANEKTAYQTTWNVPARDVTTSLKYSEMSLKGLEANLIGKNFDFSRSHLNITPSETIDLNLDQGATLEFAPVAMEKRQRNSFFAQSNISLHEVYYNGDSYFNRSAFNNLFGDNQLNFNAYYDFLQLDETSDADSNSRHYLTTQPFRLLRGVLNQHTVDIMQSEKFESSKLTKRLLLNTKFSNSGEMLKDKELMPETLWGFRQKKYKRTKKFKFKPEVIYDPVTFKVIGQKAPISSSKIDIAGLELQNIHTSAINKNEDLNVTLKDRSRGLDDNFNYRIAARINRHRSELVPVTLARRLLRTKRTLVLPAHVNLTLITNSYDVVHSWFVPGLGLKIDCVPGRSTHHTFYIDNIGFYYGQCAEICGRYHHHMPIRLCALPFEHFVVWWQSKGAARMNRTTEISKNRFLNHTFNNPVTRDKLIYRMN